MQRDSRQLDNKWELPGGWVTHILGSIRLGEPPQKMPCEEDDSEFKEKKDNLGQDKVSTLQAWNFDFGTPVPM